MEKKEIEKIKRVCLAVVEINRFTTHANLFKFLKEKDANLIAKEIRKDWISMDKNEFNRLFNSVQMKMAGFNRIN